LRSNVRLLSHSVQFPGPSKTLPSTPLRIPCGRLWLPSDIPLTPLDPLIHHDIHLTFPQFPCRGTAGLSAASVPTVSIAWARSSTCVRRGPLVYTGCTANKVQCGRDSDCGQNERCVQPGQCVCPPPYYADTEDGNRCKSPCHRFPCGVNARCTLPARLVPLRRWLVGPPRPGRVPGQPLHARRQLHQQEGQLEMNLYGGHLGRPVSGTPVCPSTSAPRTCSACHPRYRGSVSRPAPRMPTASMDSQDLSLQRWYLRQSLRWLRRRRSHVMQDTCGRGITCREGAGLVDYSVHPRG